MKSMRGSVEAIARTQSPEATICHMRLGQNTSSLQDTAFSSGSQIPSQSGLVRGEAKLTVRW